MKNNSSVATWHGAVFVFLIAQQIIAFVFDPFKFVSPYWIMVTFFTIVLFFQLKVRINEENKAPFVLFLLCSIGAMTNTILGSPIGYGLSKCFYSFFAFVGLLYISKYRINTNVFIGLLVILYVFFYYRYFIFDELTRKSIDNDLFVQASANAIPMSLNMVFIIYWMISQGQSENHKLMFVLIAAINLFLIIIQGSRAGILVAFILAILSIVNFCGFKLYFNHRLLIPLIIIIALLFYFQDYLLGFMEENKMVGTLSDEGNVRYFAQASFFANLDIKHCLLGYPKDYQFIPDLTRTYNAFLDLWSRCGLAPFLYLVYCLLIRIKNNKQYAVPFLLLIPFFAYAPFESLWGGTLWDICLFLCLFYSCNEKVSNCANDDIKQ